jgi:hypothetical protein
MMHISLVTVTGIAALAAAQNFSTGKAAAFCFNGMPRLVQNLLRPCHYSVNFPPDL